jgi:hypothetical protein
MFFFNLTAAEFLTLFGALSSAVVVLYLLDRSRRRQVVATLRFWQQSEVPSQRKHRRRIQQPWSLLLQLLAIVLLLLAVAQLRIGSPDRNSRDHVLVMDASAWMAARSSTGRTLMDDARIASLRYLRALPSVDRVMVVRADALATPVTGFETNRGTAEAAIRQMQPGTAALNLAQGLDFAVRAQRIEGKNAGEIVFAGAARLSQESVTEMPAPPNNLRILPLQGAVENMGLKKLSMRRAAADPELWEIYVTVRNYGVRPRSVPLMLAFGGAPVGTKRIDLAPGAESGSNFQFRTKAAGWLEARLQIKDALEADDSATLELPGERSSRLVVYSNEPELLRPVLAANKRLETVFRKPQEYQPDPKAAIVILDRFRPSQPVTGNAIWIEPPQAGSPIAIRGQKQDATVRWRPDQSLASGLHSKDTKVEQTSVFTIAANDIPVAEVDGQPAILARPGASKTVVFGFHPMRSALRYELATPLLFANVLRWMAPEIFVRVELQAGSVGTVSTPIDADHDASKVSVVADGKTPLPFAIRNGALRFFSGSPALVRVDMGSRELVYALSLPEVGETKWEPPKSVRTGLAGVGGAGAAARDIWQWLAVAGALLLIIEWLLFGRAIPQPVSTAGLRAAHREPPQRKAS